MAVVAVSDSNNQRDDAEDATLWGSDGAGGAGPQDETDVFYQGTQAVSRKIGTTVGGHEWVDGVTSVDMTAAADNTWMAKVIATTPSNLIATPSFGVRIGSATGDWYEYYLADDGTQGDIDYPVKGGWVVAPINPNLVAWRDALGGTAPTLSAITKFGVQGDFSAGSKAENLIIDALDLSPGLYLVGGDSTDPDGVWQDFVDDDEGTIGNRFGHVSTLEGILYVFGTLAIGQTSAATSTITVFNDSNKILIFPGGRVDDSWNQILIDTATAGTDIVFETTVFQGKGRSDLTHFFSSAGDVDGTNEEIDIVGHGFETGDLVLYSDEGGTAVTGLTDATQYFVRAVTVDSIALYAVGATAGRQNSYSDTTRVALTAAGTGQNHKLTRQPQTLPDLTQTGTNGTASFLSSGCTFDGFREITLTSRGTLSACSLLSAGGITPTGGALTDCSFQLSVLEEGEALITGPGSELANITGCTFVSEGRGHAVEVDDETGSPFSYVGNTHTGYGPDAATFHTTDDVAGGTEVITTDAAHGFVDGDHVYYNKEGGTAAIGLTDGDKYYVNEITTTTLSLHVSKTDAETDTARVDLTASGTETHSLYSGTAALLNSSGAAVTITVTGGVASPTVRNTVGSTTTINNNTEVTLTGLVDPTEVRVYADGTQTELEGSENVTTGSFVFSLGQSVVVDIRIFSVSYDPADLIGFVIPENDTSIPIQQVFDRNYNNPS